jgi:hypothetical protein
VEPGGYNAAYLESFCKSWLSLGILSGGYFIEGRSFWQVSIPKSARGVGVNF